MKQQRIAEVVAQYIDNLQRLDGMSKDLPEESRTEYRAARKDFLDRVQAWQIIAEQEQAELQRDLDTRYERLESLLIAAQHTA